MAVKGMHLSWISVSDVKKSKQFFTEVVGLKVTSSAEEYGWFELAGHEDGASLGVGECKQPSPVMPGQNAVVTMTVENVEKAKAAMEAKGVIFIGDIIEVPGHVKMVFFADPDGNKFQLVENLDG